MPSTFREKDSTTDELVVLFSLILDSKPYLLTIDEVTSSFDLEEVDSKQVYFSSDLLVTDGGDIRMPVYDSEAFLPRLFLKQGGE